MGCIKFSLPANTGPENVAPHLIKTTKLTKYVATVFQVLYGGVVNLHVNMCLKNSVDCINL